MKSNFCSNCGEKLDTNTEIDVCPRCHTTLHEHFEHIEPKPSIVEQPKPSIVEHLPYKSPGTSALIAFIGGIFGLLGIGHMYVGKVGRGIGILILGLVLFAVAITLIFLFPPIGIILSIAYIIMFIWQIFRR